MQSEPLPSPAPASQPKLTRRVFVGGITLAGVGAAIAGCSSSASKPSTGVSQSRGPRRGGTLRVGLTGGASSDTLNPLALVTTPDLARGAQLYNALVEFNTSAQIVLSLAEHIESNSDATVWTVRLRDGITFHNGKDLVADDVVYTFQQALNPKHPTASAALLVPVDLNGIRKLDRLTVRIPCKTPFSSMLEMIEPYNLPIIPVGWDQKHPIGTGPFKYKSFAPGVESTFLRNENYFESGLPYVDSVIITEYGDETSQVNALISGQEDAIGGLSATSADAVKASGNLVVISEGGGITPFTMRVDVPPFDDARVREAMRWIVDRRQMRKLVFGGYGALGNDVSSIWDPAYDHALPQREQDIARAKSLLRQAGHSGLTIELVTAPIQQGTVQAAQVLAQQARSAGVNITLRTLTSTEFFGPNYLKWVFAQDFYYYSPYLLQVTDAFLPTSPYNETHFNNPRYNQLNAIANATPDFSKRAEIEREMMSIDYTIGGYIIPYFVPVIDAHSRNLMGVTSSNTGAHLRNWELKQFWLAS